MVDQVDSFSKKALGVEWLGRRPRDEVFELMKNALVLNFPLNRYERLPMAIIEAFAVGLPVIGSKLGSGGEFITNEHAGLHFDVGNAKNLSKKVRWVIDNPDQLDLMGRHARQEFEKNFTAQQNYHELMGIYQRAIQQSDLNGNKNLISKPS